MKLEMKMILICENAEELKSNLFQVKLRNIPMKVKRHQAFVLISTLSLFSQVMNAFLNIHT